MVIYNRVLSAYLIREWYLSICNYMSEQKFQACTASLKNKSRLLKNRLSKLLPEDFFSEGFNHSPKKFKISCSTERQLNKQESKTKLISDCLMGSYEKSSSATMKVPARAQLKPIIASEEKLNQYQRKIDISTLSKGIYTCRRDHENNIAKKSSKQHLDQAERTLKNKNLENYQELLKHKLNINLNLNQIDQPPSKEKNKTIKIKCGNDTRQIRIINSQKRNRAYSDEKTNLRTSLQKEILKAIELAESRKSLFKVRDIHPSTRQISPPKIRKIKSSQQEPQTPLFPSNHTIDRDSLFVQMNFGFDGMLTFCRDSDSTGATNQSKDRGAK